MSFYFLWSSIHSWMLIFMVNVSSSQYRIFYMLYVYIFFSHYLLSCLFIGVLHFPSLWLFAHRLLSFFSCSRVCFLWLARVGAPWCCRNWIVSWPSLIGFPNRGLGVQITPIAIMWMWRKEKCSKKKKTIISKEKLGKIHVKKKKEKTSYRKKNYNRTKLNQGKY